MRFFLPRFKKPRLEAEQSALKDKLFNAFCVTDFIGNQNQKNFRKDAFHSLRRGNRSYLKNHCHA